MSESSERVKAYWSRITSGDRAAHLALSGSLAAIVLVVSLIAWSLSGSDPLTPAAPGELSDRAAELAQDPLGGLADTSSTAGPSAPGARSAGSVTAPGDTDVGGRSAGRELPPITDTEIKVGITYLEDPGTANAAAGFAGIGQVDQRRAWETLIKQYNANPLHGRKIVPVWYSQSTAEVQSKGSERLEQEACAAFTQDNKVFMVWEGTLVGGTGSFAACATKAKVPSIGAGAGLSWSDTYKKAPYLVHPGAAAMDRMAGFYVDQLVAEGFFKEFKQNEAPYTPCNQAVPCTGKPRIGLIRYDQPSYKAGATKLKERLAAHGLSLCSGCEFEVSYSGSNPSEQLDDATEVNSAIQNCKSRPQGECTHMLFLGSTAGTRIPLFFVDGAEKQRYRPRLGFTPLDSPTIVRDFLGPASYEQFRDSLLVTWNPRHFDEQAPAFKTCKKTIQDGGESFEGSEASNKEGQIGLYCDTAWYFRAALEGAGRDLSLESWMNGVNTLKPFAGSGPYQIKTTPTRHDGSSAIRVGLWATNCNCYKPITPITPV